MYSYFSLPIYPSLSDPGCDKIELCPIRIHVDLSLSGPHCDILKIEPYLRLNS